MTALKFIKLSGDNSLGLVFGFALVSTVDGARYVDTQGDWIPHDALLRASTSFMAKSRTLKLMHNGSAVGEVLFGFPMVPDVMQALGITSRRTGFVIGARPTSPALLALVKAGTLRGFSIGGKVYEEAMA